MSEKEIDAEFEKRFAIPLDGFPDYIQNMVKNACRLAHKKGYILGHKYAEGNTATLIKSLAGKILPTK